MPVEHAARLHAAPRLTAERLAAAPAAAGVVLGAGLATFIDGQRPAAWGIVGCALTVLVVAIATSGFGRWPHERPLRIALVCGAALALLGLASIAWTPMPGDAFEEGIRGLLYLLAFALPLLRRWTPDDLRRLLWLVVAAIAVVAVVTVLRGAAHDPLGIWGADRRLQGPVGYVNVGAALWLLGLVVALGIAVDARASRQVAGAGFGAAVLFATLIVLTQSRGAIISAVAAVALLLVLTELRLRSLAAVGLLAAALLGAWPSLHDVRTAGDGLDAAGAEALLVGLAIGLIGAVAWSALVALPRLDPGIGGRRRALVVVVVVALAATTVAAGNPLTFAGDRWHDVTTSGYGTINARDTRLSGGLGSDRGDFYRVALRDLRANPLRGDGLGGFRVSYLEHRDGSEAPRYAHSEPLDVAAALGLPGLLLAAAALALALVGVARTLRAQARDRLPALVAVTAVGAVLLQASFDWTWAFPAVVLPTLVLLGAVARGTRAAAPTDADAPRAQRPRTALAIALPLLALFGVLATASAAEQRATDLAGTDPAAAISWARRAAALTPSSTPPALEGLLELRRGRFAAADAALSRAVGRAPDEWFGRLERSIARARLGRTAEAAADCRVAARRYPSNPVVREVCAAIDRRQPLDPLAIERRLYAPTRARDGD
ncbi:O-antigen ligase family protein [Patulibacter defluvii]|uniref:O-antigen ligase family protein n=1 Tax=Patulibacter defluvii TaxID=3095358 RepID=UPI002A7528B5|nr:O-antigen ligase family protein [Patulibacter sp. DM4]